MKKNLKLKRTAIVITTIGVMCLCVSNVSLKAVNEKITFSIVEALAQDELPENGTCCIDKTQICALKNVSIVGKYLKKSGPCD